MKLDYKSIKDRLKFFFIKIKEIERLTNEGWQPSELAVNYAAYDINFRDYKIQGETRSMHDLMLETLSEIRLEGITLREAARELISSDDYQLAPDGIDMRDKFTTETKINMLKALFKRYKDAAKEDVIQNYGDLYVDKNGVSPRTKVLAIREEQEAKARELELETKMKNLESYWIN